MKKGQLRINVEILDGHTGAVKHIVSQLVTVRNDNVIMHESLQLEPGEDARYDYGDFQFTEHNCIGTEKVGKKRYKKQ